MSILTLIVSPKHIACGVLEVGSAEQLHIYDITRHGRNIFSFSLFSFWSKSKAISENGFINQYNTNLTVH